MLTFCFLKWKISLIKLESGFYFNLYFLFAVTVYVCGKCDWLKNWCCGKSPATGTTPVQDQLANLFARLHNLLTPAIQQGPLPPPPVNPTAPPSWMQTLGDVSNLLANDKKWKINFLIISDRVVYRVEDLVVKLGRTPLSWTRGRVWGLLVLLDLNIRSQAKLLICWFFVCKFLLTTCVILLFNF